MLTKSERSSSNPAPSEEVEGTLERITFFAQDTGYGVFRIRPPGATSTELTTLTGHYASPRVGETLHATGNWTLNKQYGKQFQAQTIRSIAPQSEEGIERYLASGWLKGIGAKTAKNLVAKFGKSVFDVFENQPAKLRTIPGMNAKKIESLLVQWKDQKELRDLMVFLQTHGVSPSKALRIQKTYGHQAIEKIQKDPYQLAKEVHGIGFRTADEIAQSIGIPRDSLVRAKAGLLYCLDQKIQEGHCAFPQTELLKAATELLETESLLLEQALAANLLSGDLVAHTIAGQHCLYPKRLFEIEGKVTEYLQKLLITPLTHLFHDPSTAVKWGEARAGIQLDTIQREALIQILNSKITILTGGPGTGKSTITRVLTLILSQEKVPFLLCSPTGRAAKRLTECTGVEAKTIHRLLGFRPGHNQPQFHEDNLLPTQFLLIDESSMVDLPLFHQLLRALPKSARLVLIGDQDQLPSVGPGQVLRDLIESQSIPTVTLKTIFRQAAESRIIQAAHAIRSGNLPDLSVQGDSDFYFVPAETPEEGVAKICEIVQTRIPKRWGLDPLHDIQVLTPMQKSLVGARHLNTELQKAVHPRPKQMIERFGYRFGIDDKVMVLQNDYDKEVFNGDIGRVVAIDEQDETVSISIDERTVSFAWNELDLLQPAYAITIHKSQGSEFPAVVIPVFMQHFMMLRKNLIYTAITRGKKRVILVGQKKALAIAVKNESDRHRWTRLGSGLAEKINLQ